MKNLTRKQIVTIVVSAVIVIALTIAGIVLGIKSNNNETKKDTDKKVESVQEDETSEEEKEKEQEKEADETVDVEDESKEETVEPETPAAEQPEQEETQQQTSSNTNTNQNQNNSNTNTGNNNGNGGGNTTTQPSTPTPIPTPEPEKSPYAGMYHERDEVSFQRVAKCAEILRGGLAGYQMRYHEEYGTIDYFSSLSIANCTTIGAWMYIVIHHWTQSADNVAGCETEPVYREIPALTKQCFEAIAPEGGTELYNTINSLIMQYGGPSYIPIQGKISESIPGLTVEIRENGPGLTIVFWAE